MEFTDQWGQALNLSVFFLFGVIAARSWDRFTTPAVLFYAVISLTLVRMAPVALALVGTRLSFPTALFMGWFGPRGLASIVLGLVYLQQSLRLPGEETIAAAVAATVLISILAHGLTAGPGTNLYNRAISTLKPDAPEHQ